MGGRGETLSFNESMGYGFAIVVLKRHGLKSISIEPFDILFSSSYPERQESGKQQRQRYKVHFCFYQSFVVISSFTTVRVNFASVLGGKDAKKAWKLNVHRSTRNA